MFPNMNKVPNHHNELITVVEILFYLKKDTTPNTETKCSVGFTFTATQTQ